MIIIKIIILYFIQIRHTDAFPPTGTLLVMIKHHMTCAVMTTLQGSIISRCKLRRGLCLPFAQVALTVCIVNEARRIFTAANQQRLNPFTGGVHNTDLSNGRILGQISRPLAQKRIKGSVNTYQKTDIFCNKCLLPIKHLKQNNILLASCKAV